MDWNDETVGKLKTLWAEGDTAPAIGKKLGVSKHAVTGKIARLDLPSRPSPIQPKSDQLVNRVPRAGLETLPAPASLALPEPSPSGTVSFAAAQLYRQMTTFIQMVAPPPADEVAAVNNHLRLIALRATTIHPDLKTMPRNVRDGVNEAVKAVITTIKKDNRGPVYFPPLPLVLNRGAALHGIESVPDRGPSIDRLISRFHHPLSRPSAGLRI